MSWWLIAVLCFALVALFAVILRRKYLVISVVGFSMVPTLQPGDRVLVRRARLTSLRSGMIIVLRDWPEDFRAERAPEWLVSPMSWLVKRLAAVPGDPVPEVARTACGNARVVPPGMMVVLSDNGGGRDSVQWGFASADQVIGHVAVSLSRSSEAGLGDHAARYRGGDNRR